MVFGQGTNKLSSYPALTSLAGTEYVPIFIPGVTNYSISANALGFWLASRIAAQPPSAHLSNWSLIPTNVLQAQGGQSAPIFDGVALTNLNASALAIGIIPASRLSGPNLIASLGYTPATNGGAVTAPDIERAIPINMRDTMIGGARSSANQTGTLRWQLMPAANCHDVQLIYVNVYRPTGDFMAPNSNAIALRASLEVDGHIMPVYFQSRRTNLLDAGATVISDPVGVSLKSTSAVFVRTFFDAGPGGFIPTSHQFNGTSTGTGNDSITYGSDLVDAGTLAPCGQVLSWGPVSVIGVPDSPARIGVVAIGDSVIYGSGESFANDANLWSAQWGFLARALRPANLGYCKLCVGSDTIGNWTNTGWMRVPAGKGATIAVCNYAINDLVGGTSVNVLKANLQSVWTYYASKRLKVFQTTCTPKSSSTDGYTSIAGQTPFPYEANRSALNAWLRDPGAVRRSRLIWRCVKWSVRRVNKGRSQQCLGCNQRSAILGHSYERRLKFRS